MSTASTSIRTIGRLERLRLSAAGNPRFRVYFTDGLVAQTEPDASINYDIENPEYRDVPLEVTFTRGGRITHLKPV